MVVVWNLRLTNGQQVPPWLLLDGLKDRYLRPVAPESVRTVEVAPASGGKPATVIAYVVLPGPVTN